MTALSLLAAAVSVRQLSKYFTKTDRHSYQSCSSRLLSELSQHCCIHNVTLEEGSFNRQKGAFMIIYLYSFSFEL